MKPRFETPQITLYQGNSLTVLPNLPETTIDCCITSPPYFAQIDYEHPEQIGLERSLNHYLELLSQVFKGVQACLKEGGCLWVIIGDTQNNYSPIRTKGNRRTAAWGDRRGLEPGYLEKEELNVPFLLGQRLREDGWVLRRSLIWDKGSSSQVANSDTAPLMHEFVLQLVKWSKGGRPYANCKPLKSSVLKHSPISNSIHPCPYPPSLVEELLIASCPLEGTVLDPFTGSGTTLFVAAEMGRKAIGVELNPDYCSLIESRCGQLTIFGGAA